MAELKFEKIINLTEATNNSAPALVEKLMIGNEPNNDIWQYFIYKKSAQDKKSSIECSNYDELKWQKVTRSMTAKRCADIGMKTFPHIGAIGFYTPLFGTSKLVVPIHAQRSTRYTPPTLSMEEKDDRLYFTITPPEDITYACYRILLQLEFFAFEYVTYELEIDVPKPTVKGDYLIYCLGYVDEGSYISEDSNVLTMSVTTGSDVPVAPQYYTSAEIDSMLNDINKEVTEVKDSIGDIGTVLDTINGEIV